MYTEPCTAGRACSWWEQGCCSAQDSTKRVVKAPKTVPPGTPICPIQDQCRWGKDAAGSCLPRLLGELCEHQPGGTFNTFLLA